MSRAARSYNFLWLSIALLPLIAISEVKGVIPQADPHHPLGGAKPKQAIHEEQ